VLRNSDRALPLSGGRRLYVENVDRDVAGEYGVVVDSPEEADVAIVRLQAPFEPRSDLFLEAHFHQGSLDFPPGLVSRMRALARQVPLIIDVTLDRAAVLTPLVDVTVALTGSYGTSDRALLDALTGAIPPSGRLPFELPRSMDEVRRSREDVPGDTADPLFAYGHGLSIQDEE
jgi:beta-glucosidase